MNPKRSSEVDVLVVGAGPVGLTLAAELLRHGVRARVVDMNEGRSVWSKAAVIHARTLEAMEAMGVAGEALSRGRKVHGLAFYSGAERIGHVSTDSLDSPYPFMLGLSQRETEEILERHLVSLGGAVERKVELTSFTQDAGQDGGVTAHLVHDESCEVVDASWLVGCDGAHSVVRKTLEVPFEGSTYEESVLQADVQIHWPFPAPPDEGLFFASPRGPIAALPLLGEGRYRLLVLLGPDDQYDPTLDNFRLLMEERGPAGARVDSPAWMVAFRFHHRIAARTRVGRVFLAGDAAHVHSPVGGQGMNLGIQDAYNLAWKLALVVKGKGRPALLDSYQAERSPIAAATLGLTDAATRLATRALGLKSPLVQRVRDQLFGLASRLPLIEDRAALLLGGLAFDYRASPIVGQHVAPPWQPAPPPPGSGAPRMTPPGGTLLDRVSFEQGPRPGQRVPDVELVTPWHGKERLFDLLHGTAHTLLLFDDGGSARHGGLRPQAPVDDGAPARYEALAGVARAVEGRYGDLVKVLVVVSHPPPAGSPDGEDEPVIDAGGALHRRFGARAACAYLVRPDGYVGYRSQPVDEERLLTYLSGVLVA